MLESEFQNKLIQELKKRMKSTPFRRDTMTVLVKLVLRHQKKRNLFQTTFGKVLPCWV